MRFVLFAILTIVFPISAAHAACEGFNHGMAALEAALGGVEVKQKTYRARDDRRGPPVAAINTAIDELEKIVHERNATAAARQVPQSYPRHTPAR